MAILFAGHSPFGQASCSHLAGLEPASPPLYARALAPGVLGYPIKRSVCLTNYALAEPQALANLAMPALHGYSAKSYLVW